MAANSRINAVILCGGEGTRLKEISKDTPKCAIDINGKPFLYYLLEQLYNSKIVDKIIISTSDKGVLIAKELIDELIDNKFGMDIIWAEEDKPQGTLIGLLASLSHITSKDLLVINGDTYCQYFDYKDFLSYHNFGNFDLSVALYLNENSGIWLIKKSLLENIIREHAVGMDKESLLCLYGFKIGYYKMRESFIDMGTVGGYEKMKESLR